MSENKTPVSQEIKKHLLTGISWMIPLIVAAGILIHGSMGMRLAIGMVTETCGLWAICFAFHDAFSVPM